jgi:hypothetical protein
VSRVRAAWRCTSRASVAFIFATLVLGSAAMAQEVGVGVALPPELLGMLTTGSPWALILAIGWRGMSVADRAVGIVDNIRRGVEEGKLQIVVSHVHTADQTSRIKVDVRLDESTEEA